ncbi:MAG: Hpt domain-containing protein [Alphaproteobacteria bacterium]|nr:Hpt domain-containing protein [Alphaproteobacteria bacterium]
MTDDFPAVLLDEAKLCQWQDLLGLAKLQSLVGTYRASSAQNFADLEAALAQEDVERVGRMAHKIAGAAVNLGFAALYRQGKAAEAAASKGDGAGAFSQACAMSHLQAASLEALEAWLARDIEEK